MRIAREMHDDWTQRLALLGIDAANLENQLVENDSAVGLVHAISEQLVSLADDVHALSRQLHPSIIDDLGLAEAPAIPSAPAFRGEKELQSNVSLTIFLPICQDIALCIYRVAQESLRNIAKHAAVSEATVKLDSTRGELSLQVVDAGLGFCTENGHSRIGIGLASMEERVHLVRGRFTIRSVPEKGTTVEVHVSMDNDRYE